MRLLRWFVFPFLYLSLWSQDPALREAFLQAKATWASQGNREDATTRFDSVVSALAPKAKTLDPEWLQVLCESYNWLAVLDDRSSTTKPRSLIRFQALVDLNPDFELDKALTSQRLVALHERVRGEKYAAVHLTYAPEGGRLLVDGQVCPTLPRKFLPFGTHKLAYQRPGHTPSEQTIELAPKDAKTLAFNLTRIASTIILQTSPSGPEVLLDGRSLGHTTGKAGAESTALAISVGLRPEDLSEPFIIPELSPGKHRLELQGPCFRPRVLTLGEELSKPFADHTLEPIRMVPSRGTLSVQSAWPGGELFLSGESRGPLPIKDLSVCSGSYDLMVRFPAGGFSKHIVLDDGKALTLEVRPRPRMAFLGLEGGDFTGRSRFEGQLAGLGERLQRLAFVPPRPGETPADALARFKATKEVELILTAAPVPDKVLHQIKLTLATLDGEEERQLVKPLEEDPLALLVQRLNQMPPIQQTGMGITLLDLPGEPGPWILAEDEAAQKAGIQLNKPLLEVNGQPVSTLKAALQSLDASKGTTTLKQGDQVLSVPTQTDFLEVPLGRPDLSYPALLANLRLQYPGAKGEEANLLKLNMGLILMHFRKYDKAIEVLRDTHLNTTHGVSQGTLDYHIGRCFLRLGPAYQTEAAQAFRQALKYPQATLLGPSGPLVAPLAKQALEDLK
jgi:hypothetical protein